MNAAQRRRTRRAIGRLKGQRVLVKNWRTNGRWLHGTLMKHDIYDTGCAVVCLDLPHGTTADRQTRVHIKRIRASGGAS